MKKLLRNVAYASVIVAALTVTIQSLNRPASAQPPGRVIVGTYMGDYDKPVVMLDNGDVYRLPVGFGGPPQYMGNFWGDQPINVSPSTWSGLKTKLGTPSGN